MFRFLVIAILGLILLTLIAGREIVVLVIAGVVVLFILWAVILWLCVSEDFRRAVMAIILAAGLLFVMHYADTKIAEIRRSSQAK